MMNKYSWNENITLWWTQKTRNKAKMYHMTQYWAFVVVVFLFHLFKEKKKNLSLTMFSYLKFCLIYSNGLIISGSQTKALAQSLSCVWPFATPWTVACQASLSFIISLSLLMLMSIELVMSSKHLILFFPLFLLPSIFPSLRVSSKESALHISWPKYWSFGFHICPCNEYSGLISFRIDWLDFLPVQGTLKNLLQHHSSEAVILQCSAFFMVQLSHPYMTTGGKKKKNSFD